MDGRIEVEVVGPDRWRQVRELRLAALADTPDAYGMTLDHEQGQPETWWRERLQREDAATLVASIVGERDARPVGLSVVGPWNGDAEAVGLFAVWVAPAGRGRGVGDALISVAIEQARGRGARRLLLHVGDHNEPAIGLYERHGFVPTGRTGSLPPPRQHVVEHERALELTTDA
jgi:ribosomal protein S18 acetylase RimI-like enzyme